MPPKREGSSLDEPRAKKPKSETVSKTAPVSKPESTDKITMDKSKSAVKLAANKRSTPESPTFFNDKNRALSDTMESKSKKIKYSDENWSALSVMELKKELEGRGLSKIGKKAELVARLKSVSIILGFALRSRLI